jgi:hypothetical protein
MGLDMGGMELIRFGWMDGRRKEDSHEVPGI